MMTATTTGGTTERPDADTSPTQDRGDLDALLRLIRQARIIEIAAIERYLGLPPSRSRRKRDDQTARMWHNEDEAYLGIGPARSER